MFLSGEEAQVAGGPEHLSIYKLSRLIKREQNDLYNSLRSIYEDTLFVQEIRRLYASLPLLANLRCGIWYSPQFDGSCYFKSTDGHTGNWSFSCTRLNIHVAQLAAENGGCIIVDATRRGKRYPDSLSKTIPIWCSVVNRAVDRTRKQSRQEKFNDASEQILQSDEVLKELTGAFQCRDRDESTQQDENEALVGGVQHLQTAVSDTSSPSCERESEVHGQEGWESSNCKDPDKSGTHSCRISTGFNGNGGLKATHSPTGSNQAAYKEEGFDERQGGLEGENQSDEREDASGWRALHLPLWLSPTEKAAIEKRMEGWVDLLMTSGADLTSIVRTLRKPLRPLWISQRTVIWLNEMPDISALPFTPLICLSASEPSLRPRHVTGEGAGWTYVPGAADDEESWARGLSASLFWRNAHSILDNGPSGCKAAVARLVEEDRVRSALRSTGFGPKQEASVRGSANACDSPSQTSGESAQRAGSSTHRGSCDEAKQHERAEVGDGSVVSTSRKQVAPQSRKEGAETLERWKQGSEQRNEEPQASDCASPLEEAPGSAPHAINGQDSVLHASVQLELQEDSFPFDERGERSAESTPRFGPWPLMAAAQDDRRLSIIGQTGLAIGSATCCGDPEVWQSVHAIVDCSPTPHADCAKMTGRYLHLPIQVAKFDRHSLERHLPEAVAFARAHLENRTKLLVVCKDGYNVSVCVCLAIFMACFDSEGAFVQDKDLGHVTKAMVRQGLAILSSFHSEARPSRGNLKQVFHFLGGGDIEVAVSRANQKQVSKPQLEQ